MSFFKNLFNEATKFVEEHSKNLEKTFDEIKGELGAKFNEALLAEQNNGKTPSNQEEKQESYAVSNTENYVSDVPENAEMKALAEKPLLALQEEINTYGLPKETFFITQNDVQIDFKGDLIYLRGEDDQIKESTYLFIQEDENLQETRLIITDVDYKNGEIEDVRVFDALAFYLIGSPYGEVTGATIDDKRSSSAGTYMSLNSGTYKLNFSLYYAPTETQENEHYEDDRLCFYARSLEDALTIAARIFPYMNEYAQKDYQQYIERLQAGTSVEYEPTNTDENDYQNNDYQEDTYQNDNDNSSNTEITEATIELANRSNAEVDVMIESARGGSKSNFSINSSSTKKELIDIKIKNDQKDGSVTIYNQNRGGSYNIQRGITTTIKCYVGDKLFDYEGHKKGRLLFVVEENMDGKVQLFTKL